MVRQKITSKWILIISGFFALLELFMGISLYFSPKEILDELDFNAKGVDYLICMWAVRQFALGFIFGFAVFKKSTPMLTIAYIFFLVMFFGDFFIGLTQKNSVLIISALFMCVVSSIMLFVLNKRAQ